MTAAVKVSLLNLGENEVLQEFLGISASVDKSYDRLIGRCPQMPASVE